MQSQTTCQLVVKSLACSKQTKQEDHKELTETKQ